MAGSGTAAPVGSMSVIGIFRQLSQLGHGRLFGFLLITERLTEILANCRALPT